ncbi:MAG: hypothetical protein HY722_02950 [Planctomycetes bacterium]|nr:hypothetical protein [Planctomycetota bacterium]
MTPRDDPDVTDPLEAVAVSCPAGPEALEAMATAFVEEFLSQGLPPERVVALFRDPFYAAPHGVWRARGEAYVRSLVARARRPGRAVQGGQ